MTQNHKYPEQAFPEAWAERRKTYALLQIHFYFGHDICDATIHLTYIILRHVKAETYSTHFRVWLDINTATSHTTYSYTKNYE
jgi:hypothetical protein